MRGDAARMRSAREKTFGIFCGENPKWQQRQNAFRMAWPLSAAEEDRRRGQPGRRANYGIQGTYIAV